MSGARPRRAVVVCDLGFGDAGKGLCTDWLVRRLGARWVIRWNGGAQAGHNVVASDGRHHTFSQLGAGTLSPGVRTFLGPDFVLHPAALVVEVERLARLGVGDALGRLAVSAAARVVTPFHQAMGRLREIVRGAARHGSCGVGIGETVRDDLERPEETLRAVDLRDRARLIERLRAVRERKRAEAAALIERAARASGVDPLGEAVMRERAVFDAREGDGVIERWALLAAEVCARIALVDDLAAPPFLEGAAPLVMEGAQGVLLDEWHGFHPHTSWSTCTFGPALSLLVRAGFDGEVLRLGVLRAYAVRHGHGPLPTEDAALAASLVEPHNRDGAWQGPFRAGWPDFVLARYALAAAGGADALALTHLDTVARLDALRAAHAYALRGDEPPGLFAVDERDPLRASNLVASHSLATAPRLARQEALGRALAAVTPIYRPIDRAPNGGADSCIAAFEESLGVPVALAGYGPRADDVRAHGRLVVSAAG